MVWNFNLVAADLGQLAGQMGGILPIVLIMVIFYVLLILPAQKRQKKVAQMLSELKNGDKVITTGGVYGTIVGIEDDAIQLRIADQVKIKVLRSAVGGLQPENKESQRAEIIGNSPLVCWERLSEVQR
jgi:preprotein translocase subunit YajC